MVRENHPILFEVAQPSIGLTTDDLVDVNHPVNSKSLSGKRKGMGVMIDDVIYVAMGSSPDARWVQFSDIKEPVPAPPKEAVFEIRENLNHTMLRDLALGQSESVNVDKMPPLDVENAGAGFMMIKSGKVGFQILKTGIYKTIISGFLHGQDPLLEGTRATVFLHNGRGSGSVMLGGSDSVVFHKGKDDALFAHFTLVAYDHLSENDTIMLKVAGEKSAAADGQGNINKPVVIENTVLSVEVI